MASPAGWGYRQGRVPAGWGVQENLGHPSGVVSELQTFGAYLRAPKNEFGTRSLD